MKLKLVTLGIISLAAAQTAYAAQAVQTTQVENTSPINFNSSSISASASLGILSAETKEYLYNPISGDKTSELIWKIKNTAVIKGDLAWDALPYLTLNARGWYASSSKSGKMDDYDWMNGSQSKWTHWSHHENTKLNSASEFDINVKGWILKQPEYKLGGVLGYQQTDFSWEATGGHGIYENKPKTFENKPLITYKQKFNTPYLGLTGQYRYQDFEFNALLKFSPWVKAKDTDEHILNNETFKAKTSNSRYYSIGVDAGYYITPNVKVFSELTWNKFDNNKKGDVQLTNHSERSSETYRNTGSMGNTNYTISAGVQYRF
ncbi:omptin family outer membrane protease [Xenorhabdus szentirmaii]|uniref:omptin family outer membrane protease n=1 Tax=Xenorhabdus szentirmaii TaxID=290112 RepID=UPI000C0510BC|nr:MULTISPECIES: omptin family outer membrane protease [Xenorhabdus]MBD2782683.1 omptin family outer membrane protease [Xenorhabdus sp. 38]MBD2793855.1 omptin family outer membrane protease [Xenorhabdus sp. CUL]MBD2806670.1 omptin family outer membrane protease [Xenorhabdus sp. ZM]MBD2824561.1 omptin family outer membrane protease [Xenorhabdus sp. 5]PHM42778.1 plasminogen activator protease precursor [Xenorhabdus szentirmaii]